VKLDQLVQEVTSSVSKNEYFLNFSRIQSSKTKGIRYHPMFLGWTISVYIRAGNTAYKIMKGITRLLSVFIEKDLSAISWVLWLQKIYLTVG